jgi:hypothetical protein
VAQRSDSKDQGIAREAKKTTDALKQEVDLVMEVDEKEEGEPVNETRVTPKPHPVDSDYEKAVLRANRVDLVIIGESPYDEEDGPTGVPFITETWEQLRNPVCSGQYIIQSVTGQWIYSIAQSCKESTPIEFAVEHLLQVHGVVLLNAAYALPTDDQIAAEAGPQGEITNSQYKGRCQRARERLIRAMMRVDWDRCNKDLLRKILRRHSPMIIMCGVKIRGEVGSDIRAMGAEVVNPCHPALFNVQTPKRYREWLEYWDVGKLGNFIIERRRKAE